MTKRLGTVIALAADHWSRADVDGLSRAGADGFTLVADLCRIALCGPADPVLDGRFAALLGSRVGRSPWTDVLVRNPWLLPDAIPMVRMVVRMAAAEASPRERERLAKAAAAGVSVLRRLLESPAAHVRERKAHQQAEWLLGAAALGLVPPHPPAGPDAARDWTGWWAESFLGVAPRLWQWPDQNLMPMLRCAWGLASAPPAERLRLGVGHVRHLAHAISGHLAQAVQAAKPEMAALLLPAASAVDGVAAPLVAAGWRTVANSPGFLERQKPSPSSTRAAVALLVSHRSMEAREGGLSDVESHRRRAAT